MFPVIQTRRGYLLQIVVFYESNRKGEDNAHSFLYPKTDAAGVVQRMVIIRGPSSEAAWPLLFL